MNDLTLSHFNYKSRQLRVIKDNNGKFWFYAKDICNLLGYENASDAINKHIGICDKISLTYKAVKENSKTLLSEFWPKSGTYNSQIFVTEFGVNDLIIHSHARRARKIQHWITHEVIPSIVHKGGYISNSTQFFGNMNNNQIDMLEHTLDLVKKRNNQNKKLRQNNYALAKKKKQMTPTYDYGRGMSANIDHTFTTKEAAHIFSNRFNLTNCGTVNFNRVLRSKPMSILSNQRGKNHNLPRKYYIDHKWCIVHYSHIVSPVAHKKIVCRTVYFTAKGVKGILDKFKQNRIFIPYKDWNPAVLDTKWLDKNYIYKNKKYLEHCGGKGNINKIHYVQDIL